MGLGTAALVLGIVAVVFSFIPLVGIIAWPIGITGLILGFVGLARVNRREATNRGVAIAGLITSGAALVICVLWLVGIGIAGSQATPPRATLPTAGAVPAAQTDPQAAPAKPAGPATSFGDGTYEVGVDVAAGRYKTRGPTDDLFELLLAADEGRLGPVPVDHRQRQHPRPGIGDDQGWGVLPNLRRLHLDEAVTHTRTDSPTRWNSFRSE